MSIDVVMKPLMPKNDRFRTRCARTTLRWPSSGRQRDSEVLDASQPRRVRMILPTVMRRRDGGG
jgi:hypothetical protein